MSSSSTTPAFAPHSAFTPGRSGSVRTATSPRSGSAPTMVAPKNVRRSEEIKRLTKQLEELRAARDQIARKASPSAQPAAAAPKPPESPAPRAPPARAGADAFSRASSPSAGTLSVGKHAEGNRFLSLSQLEGEEYFPRVLTVAGRVPDLTVQQLLDTPPVLQNRSPEPGNMFLTMLPPEYKGQIIAMPGFELVSKCKDPVVILIDPAELSRTQLPIADGDDIVLLLERNMEEFEFDASKFYAWADGDKVRVGWLKEEPSPDQARCLGQIIFGMMEVKKELRETKSCWEEENETYS